MELIVGRAYAGHGGFAREIIDIEDGRVYYRDFSLHDGKPWSSWRSCQRGTFRNFAARECTPEEVTGFRRDEIPREDQSREELGEKIMAIVAQCQLETSLQ
jgi:hypothetical protein